ncbi:cupin domain-containing protein [Rhizomicrobium electricum]|uniref:Cupin type-2 domain-containing protein n=1 Tax=Rhizomicrobium electricum TaxID=480070 RepID=A0ABN1F5S1_9PROT|nr:cupin domain-containing protein [Rhizomicrobium electricum]NIJ50496.1 mannose-6-phosphate isomerase-like protein (cupin superfamily) [Rhizomicrobium electricum]
MIAKVLPGAAAIFLFTAGAVAAPPMVVTDEKTIAKDEPPPHGAIGMSTVSAFSASAPGRMMEFKKRVLHKGAALGLHPIAHDEVYYVVSGTGEVVSDGDKKIMTAGMAAYLYNGANVGISQMGEEPLVLIVAYPLAAPAK